MRSGDIYPTLGASGGVFGLLLAFALSFPNEKLMLLFPPVIIKAKWFVLIYACVGLIAGVTGSLAGIAHFAHLGGMCYLAFYYYGTGEFKAFKGAEPFNTSYTQYIKAGQVSPIVNYCFPIN